MNNLLFKGIDGDKSVNAAQYVTFSIGEEYYGVNATKVHEIIGMTKITHVPNSMAYMKGIINLRGSVVPVVDMRVKFTMEEKEYSDQTIIIIVEIKGRLFGMIVDSVSDVIGIAENSIQDTPHFSTKIESDFISGISNKNDQLIIMLDVDRILTSEEILEVETKTA